MAEEKKLSGLDFMEGVSITEFAGGGMVQGHANGEAILVARRCLLGIGVSCTHYGGALAEGLIAGDYRPMPMVSCLFQSSHRRGPPRSGA
jgi:hypothetical protein